MSLFHPVNFEPVVRRTLGCGDEGLETYVINSAKVLRKLVDRGYLGKDLALWDVARRGEPLPTAGLLGIAQMRSMLSTDGKCHQRQRAPASRAFHASRLELLGPRITEITYDVLDGLKRNFDPDEDVDLRKAFATPIPLQTFCELLGLDDPADRAELAAHGHTLLGTSSTPQQVNAALTGIHRLLTCIVDRKIAEPGDDLVSDLVAAAYDHEAITEAELMANLMILYIGGHATTANVLTNANYGLLTAPHQLELALSGAATWDDVFEETCRWAGAVSVAWGYYMRRGARIGQTYIPQGASVSFGLEAIGRDPYIHGDDAGAFRVLRPTRTKHLAFGYGDHNCVGRALARLEFVIAMPALHQAFPRLSLAPDATPRRTDEEVMIALDGLMVRMGKPRNPLSLR